LQVDCCSLLPCRFTAAGRLLLSAALYGSVAPYDPAGRLLLSISLQVQAALTVVQEVEKSVGNQKVASSIPCRSVLEQDTEPLIAPDVQCAISVKCKMCIRSAERR